MNCAVIPPHNLLLQSCMPKDNCAGLESSHSGGLAHPIPWADSHVVAHLCDHRNIRISQSHGQTETFTWLKWLEVTWGCSGLLSQQQQITSGSPSHSPAWERSMGSTLITAGSSWKLPEPTRLGFLILYKKKKAWHMEKAWKLIVSRSASWLCLSPSKKELCF